jgi:hypothetical protein
MPASQAPNIGLNYKWSLGESGWNLEMDENLVTIDALLLLSVKSATTSTPPGTPSNGDRYIVAATATGDWLSQEGKVAQWDNAASAWNFYTPQDGWFCRAQDSQQSYVFASSAWNLVGSLYGLYADDLAAIAASLPEGGVYVRSVTGALHVQSPLTLDAQVLLRVLSATTTAPPGSPSDRDTYVVPPSATGAWAGQDEDVAQWNDTDSQWEFFTPGEGWMARADDSGQPHVFSGSAWGLESALYGQYADDTAAATGGVAVGGYYVNSSTGALTVRLS